MSATLPITVGVPQQLPDGSKLYAIVRGDGRIAFVKEVAMGTAQCGLPRRGGIDWGDPCTLDAAITVAKAYLRGAA